jgi:hypothetical protein
LLSQAAHLQYQTKFHPDYRPNRSEVFSIKEIPQVSFILADKELLIADFTACSLHAQGNIWGLLTKPKKDLSGTKLRSQRYVSN